MQKVAFRNAVQIDGDRFDCEICHPQFGWIPFTADPNDVEPHGREIWDAIKQAGTQDKKAKA